MSDQEANENSDFKPAEQRFAGFLARGFNQSEAYRKAFGVKGVSQPRVAERASRLAAKPQVIAMVGEILREARIADIDAAAVAYKELLYDLEQARAAANWTAVSQLQRLRLQCLGAVRDNVMVTVEQTMSDDALVKALAADNPEMAAQFRRMLGADRRATTH